MQYWPSQLVTVPAAELVDDGRVLQLGDQVGALPERAGVAVDVEHHDEPIRP